MLRVQGEGSRVRILVKAETLEFRCFVFFTTPLSPFNYDVHVTSVGESKGDSDFSDYVTPDGHRNR